MPETFRPIPYHHVRIQDSFWAPRREINRRVTIPGLLDRLDSEGYFKAFQLAALDATEGDSGPVFRDADAYKLLEAASYLLAESPNEKLEKRVETIIRMIAAAQMEDGYLNSWYRIHAPEKRWTNLRDGHELYCAGHLFEAAAAHYEATGRTTLLDVAQKFAAHIGRVFGEKGEREGAYGGHPEVELALVRLSRATGKQEFLDLACRFVESRGSRYFSREHPEGSPLDDGSGAYWQDDLPIREHQTLKGHCVGALSLMAGATDAAAETGDAKMIDMLGRVWAGAMSRRIYLTGGAGSSHKNGSFTEDYDLPNARAYQETCASIAMAAWAQRMCQLFGDAQYADAMEQALYNGVLAGVSLDGRRFFHVNPLESEGGHHRQEWFGSACCPANVARTLARIGGFAYATTNTAIEVNLYIQGGVETELAGKAVSLFVTTDYPWKGEVQIIVKAAEPTRFELRLRAPAWCGQQPEIRVNGSPATTPRLRKGYITIDRTWQTGDWVELDLPMDVRRIEANPAVKECRGKVAFARGPLVYCFEQVDQPVNLEGASIPIFASHDFTPDQRPSVLGSAVVLRGVGASSTDQQWGEELYRNAQPARTVPLTAIPYYAWDNRESGPMKVWMPVVS